MDLPASHFVHSWTWSAHTEALIQVLDKCQPTPSDDDQKFSYNRYRCVHLSGLILVGPCTAAAIRFVTLATQAESYSHSHAISSISVIPRFASRFASSSKSF